MTPLATVDHGQAATGSAYSEAAAEAFRNELAGVWPTEVKVTVVPV